MCFLCGVAYMITHTIADVIMEIWHPQTLLMVPKCRCFPTGKLLMSHKSKYDPIHCYPKPIYGTGLACKMLKLLHYNGVLTHMFVRLSNMPKWCSGQILSPLREKLCWVWYDIKIWNIFKLNRVKLHFCNVLFYNIKIHEQCHLMKV